MFPYRPALVIVAAGLLTFGLVFTLLQVTRSMAAAGPPVPAVSTPIVSAIKPAPNSLAVQLVGQQSAVGVPVVGSEPLLRDLAAGDRLDVLASLPSPADGRPVTAVVVRGATVMRPPSAPDPLLLAVAEPDAIVLAHLVLGGTRLGYVIWPANGSPPEPRPLDERAARALLGLSARPVATVLVATPTPAPPTPRPQPATPAPTPAIAAPVGGFIYQVQDGDTWDGVAAMFKLSAAELRQWNEAPSNAGLDPGTLVFVPRKP